MKIGEAAKSLLLLVVSSCLCLLVTGFVLQGLFPDGQVIYQLDQACLYRLVPGATKVFRHFRVNRREGIVVKINSRGFRGEELAPPRQGLARIVVYGDSFIEAESSRLEDTFAKRLESRLNVRPGRPVEVVNAGVVGYGPDQISVRMGDELAALGPDLVIVAVCSGNDFGDLLRNKIYKLGPAGQLVRNRFVLHWALESHLAHAGTAAVKPRGTLRRVFERLRWAFDRRFLEPPGKPALREDSDPIDWSLKVCRFEYEDYVLGGNNTVTSLLEDPYDADVSLFPESESARYKVWLMEAVLRAIGATAGERRVPLLLLIVPYPIDVERGHHLRVRSGLLSGHKPSTLTDVLEAIAVRNGIRHVNLFPAFRSARPKQLFYAEPETHWNPDGEDLAARVVADYLVSSGIFPGTGPS